MNEYRIFLASPGDLGPERDLLDQLTKRYNDEMSQGIRFDLWGWESAPGTVGRPQETINQWVHESDFLVLLLKEKWGSSPGGTGCYSSGTEEELFTALMDMGDESRRMRDVWVSFVGRGRPDQEVAAFKNKLEEQRVLQYEKTLTPGELENRYLRRLSAWERQIHQAKTETGAVPRKTVEVYMAPSGAFDCNGKQRADGKCDVLEIARLMRQAEQLVVLDPSTAESNLRKAAAIGGANELRALAKFQSRAEKFDAALQTLKQALNSLPEIEKTSETAAEIYADQASIWRRMNQPEKAREHLKSALRLCVVHDERSARIRARILDYIGLAHQTLQNYEGAKQAFIDSKKIREEWGDPTGEISSLVNLGRLSLKYGQDSRTLEIGKTLLPILEEAPSSSGVANGYLFMSQLHFAKGEYASAARMAKFSVQINRSVSNNYGLSIALLQEAKVLWKEENLQGAQQRARESLTINEEIHNSYGVQEASKFLEEIS